MRSLVLLAFLVATLIAAACGGSSTPVSPTVATPAGVGTENGSQAGGAGTGVPSTAPAVGLTGVIRDLTPGGGTFLLVMRTGTRTVVTDADTQVWARGTQTRVSALRDGQAVSIRGHDYTRYVLARTISLN